MFDFTSLTTLYSWTVTGVCALGIGLVGLLARRSQSTNRPWSIPLLAAGGIALSAGGVAVSGESLVVAGPLALLAVAFLLLAILRTNLPRLMGRWTLSVLAIPRVQSFGLLIVGAAILCWQSWSLTVKIETEMEESERHLSVLTMPSLRHYTALTSRTDGGNDVPLWEVVPGEESTTEEEMDYLSRTNFGVKLIQTDGPDARYNCHGWVFTGGKAWIRGGSVEQILRDNRYEITTRPSAGDVAVYRDELGEVTHTALVRGYISDGTLLLESKWGKLGRYIHTEKDHAYKIHTCTYYTTRRGGHVLQTEPAE